MSFFTSLSTEWLFTSLSTGVAFTSLSTGFQFVLGWIHMLVQHRFVTFFIYLFYRCINIRSLVSLKESKGPQVPGPCQSTTYNLRPALPRLNIWGPLEGGRSGQLPIFPATATHVALYLQHLGKTKGSRAATEEAVNGITWAYSMAGLPSPTADPFV